MYRRPKFLEVLLEIRREMALESDYDVDLFAEIARSGCKSTSKSRRSSHDRIDTISENEDLDIPTLINSKDS